MEEKGQERTRLMEAKMEEKVWEGIRLLGGKGGRDGGGQSCREG